ncbi:MAG: hypothetical protein OXS29_15460 [bacterium]|nr:hypothetical protein [bacterium]MDE0289973.1 hypothetical protein [bacterium]MDE0437233.1 hypothetical protein [bacterium]
MTPGSAARRVAAVDMGTNSTRLLIADRRETGLVDVERIETVTGLGRGVDRSARLSPDGIERTARVLQSYGRRIRQAGVQAARAVATSAARDASNRDEFVEAATRALGFRPDIISGEEEAGLVFAGATGGTRDPGATVVVDIGGGSTEIVTDEGGVSTDIGSIRLTERCLPNHPATVRDLAAARREAARVMSAADLPRRSYAMGAAGTWTSLAAMHLRLDSYDSHEVEGTTLGVEDAERMVAWLGSLSLADKKAIRSLNPKRAPIILGGAVVAETSLRLLGLKRITVTGHDILDGVCLSVAGGQWPVVGGP